jgi:uncharacterized membrane protein
VYDRSPPPDRLPLIVLTVGAALGLLFASVSTYDFAQHLDRQVHGLHCSIIPGLGAPDASGTSGCHVTLMSPYSSVLRSLFWGGLPVSLPGMSMFAFLLWRGASGLLSPSGQDKGAAQALLAAATIPLLTSLGMGTLSLFVLDALCKVCLGIYISSLVSFIGAVWAYRAQGARGGIEDAIGDLPSAAPSRALGLLGALVGFVALPAAAWAALVPDHGKYIGTCGKLTATDDPKGVLLPLDPHPGGRAAIEVLDPLCPSCKGFEDRLLASGHAGALDRKVLLFPLDNSCNWMVGGTMHPGACTISEAVLCAKTDAKRVIDWAFVHQEQIRTEAAADPEAAKRLVLQQFPELKNCVGGANVKAQLNQSLRWAVKNELPVLTPQLYVDGVRLCDADTDLGLDFALGTILSAPPSSPVGAAAPARGDR